MSKIKIRNVNIHDAGAISEIYRFYVENTAITFEYTAPDSDEIKSRIAAISADYPYVVAEKDGEVIGYAYASRLRSRPAFMWSAELSVYVKKDHRGVGTGMLLYNELETMLHRMGITNVYACIAYSDEDDEFLDESSIRFHEKAGYERCGFFERCASKFGKWYGVVWMCKRIGDTVPYPTQPEFKTYSGRADI